MPTTVGQILVNEVLPPKYRDYRRTMGKKEMEEVLAEIAKNDPDAYRDVSFGLMDAGNKAAYYGGTTLHLSDLASPVDKSGVFAKLDEVENAIRAMPNLTEEQKEERIEALYDDAYSGLKEMVLQNATAAGNPFGMQVKSKARGDPNQLSAMLATPGTYSTSDGRMVPMFIRHSFAEGLSPAEYWAGSYGARTGVISTKFATRKAGELGKLMSSASIEQVVTEDDCGTPYGMPVKADDPDNEGCVLAQAAGDYGAGTVVTRQVISDLKNNGIEDIVVRSPVTCGAKNGLCAHCCGIRENGKFPELGYNAGLNAASALSERIAQGSLNTKHSGKKMKGAGRYQGFEMIKHMTTVPKVYPDRAAVASEDGRITKIEKAPQGGSYIYVGDKRHYVQPGYDISVKEGDEVEAGDQLSDGVINPADVVRYKGIGEGRRYFANRFTQAFRDSGYAVDRRNVEVLSRALVNNVQIDDENAEGQMLPGDNVSYSRWAFGYRPRPDSVSGAPSKFVGQYLEQPALHYTIGTRITRKVADELGKFGVKSVLANRNPAGVTPQMQSIVKTTGASDDWMARLGTTYLGKRFVEDVQRGAVSDAHGVNPYPAVAKGTELGQFGTPGFRDEKRFRY